MIYKLSPIETQIREGVHDYIRKNGRYPKSVTVPSWIISQQYLLANAVEHELDGVKTSYIFGVPIKFMLINPNEPLLGERIEI